MRVEVNYENDPNYPLLVAQYGKKQALKILHSGIPINKPSVVPSLQVPSHRHNCDGLPNLAGLGTEGSWWPSSIPELPNVTGGWLLNPAIRTYNELANPGEITLPPTLPPAAPTEDQLREMYRSGQQSSWSPSSMSERTQQAQTAQQTGYTAGLITGSNSGGPASETLVSDKQLLIVLGALGLGVLVLAAKR